jgi:ribosomal-protein-serine acetyltransferase
LVEQPGGHCCIEPECAGEAQQRGGAPSWKAKKGPNHSTVHDLSSLSGEAEAVARDDRSMQQCPGWSSPGGVSIRNLVAATAADRHHPVMGQPSEVLTYGPARLRRWLATDAGTIYRVVMESLEHLRPWMPWAAEYSRDDAVGFTTQSEQDWESGVAYQYAITIPDAVVGSCGLMRRIGPGGLEIGYWLHPAYTGRGLATAAAAALVGQAFALQDIDRVEIVHDAANTASGGIPRRLGFTEIERRTSAQRPVASGESGVEVVWRLTRA